MKWFKHDSNANTDAKLKKLRHKFGIQAYGLYWYCLELIAGRVDKENITFELEEDAETIAMEWNMDQIKVQEMMQYMCEIRLFESNSGVISCLKLARRLDDTNAKNPQIRAVIDRINRSDSELVGVNRSDSEKVAPDKIRLDKNKNNCPDRAGFKKPKLEDIQAYCQQRNSTVDPEAFFDHYTTVGWVYGKDKKPIKDWKACVRTWEKRSKGKNTEGAFSWE